MPANKKITDRKDLITRKPYRTILNILVIVGKPLTLAHVLFLLNKPSKPLSIKKATKTNYSVRKVKIAAVDIEKIKTAGISIHELNIKRQRLYEILNILIEYGLVFKENEDDLVTKENVMSNAKKKVKNIVKYRAFTDNVLQYQIFLAFDRLPFKDENEFMRNAHDFDTIVKIMGEKDIFDRYSILAVKKLLMDLTHDMRKKFNNKLASFGKNYDQFEFNLEVKVYQKKLDEIRF